MVFPGEKNEARGRGEAHCPSAALQVDVIKKAYLQEEECENAEVSPREVGHNIYILALQVLSLARLGSPCRAALPLTGLHLFLCIYLCFLQPGMAGNVLLAPVGSQPPRSPERPVSLSPARPTSRSLCAVAAHRLCHRCPSSSCPDTTSPCSSS